MGGKGQGSNGIAWNDFDAVFDELCRLSNRNDKNVDLKEERDSRNSSIATSATSLRSSLESDIIEFCRPRMAGFKRPKVVLPIAELPKTSTGKTLKYELRKSLK